MSLLSIIFINLLLFFGAYIQGIVGFGIGILCASVFAVYMPEMVPGPMIILSILLAIIMLVRGRQEINIRMIQWPVYGAIGGIICAGWVITLLSKTYFDLLFGALLLILVVLSLLKPVFSGNLAGISAGYLSGLMGTITAIGGPPMGLLLKEERPAMVRANLALFFLISSIIATIILSLVGSIRANEIWLALAGCPGMLIGYVLSQKVRLFQNQQIVRTSILLVSIICAIYILVRGSIALT